MGRGKKKNRIGKGSNWKTQNITGFCYQEEENGGVGKGRLFMTFVFTERMEQ